MLGRGLYVSVAVSNVLQYTLWYMCISEAIVVYVYGFDMGAVTYLPCGVSNEG